MITDNNINPPPLRLVLDTNIYIAAALNPESLLYKIVRDSASRKFAIYFTSEEVLLELQNKLETKFFFDRNRTVEWMRQLRSATEVVYPATRVAIIEGDPDDNKILECALEARADLIISADKDLLTLKVYEDIKIIHPSSFKYVFPKLNGQGKQFENR